MGMNDIETIQPQIAAQGKYASYIPPSPFAPDGKIFHFDSSVF